MKGPFTRLPQPPRDRNGISPFELAKWFDKIYLILAGIPGISWDVIDKAGSKLSDLETRWHSMLQNVYGADVTNSGQVIEDVDHVKHVSDAQSEVWQQGAFLAQNSMTENVMTSRQNSSRGDTQALNWM